MDISVIVPVYNVENYIERCLRSLFEQTKSEGVEFILVNDCTPDGSMMIARRVAGEYPQHEIKFIDKEVNEGLVAARLSGIDIAQGEYIVHVDSDDWCEPRMLEELYAKAQESAADIVVCDYLFNRNSGQEYIKSKLRGSNIECITTMLFEEGQGAVWNKIYRRNLYSKSDIQPLVGVNMWEDIYINTILFSRAKVITYLPNAYLHYMRDNSDCITFRKDNTKQFCEMLRVIKEIDLFFDRQDSLKVCKEALNYRKALLKLLCLESCRGGKQREYMSLFPELKVAVWRLKKLRLHKKVLLFLADHKQQNIFNSISYLRNIVIRFVK